MKQKPIFILLTFFIALFSVVLITFVFLRTQLNEKKLQNLVSESIKKNFPDYNVDFGHIGLNLGTKFRYKIDKVYIRHNAEQPFFANIILENVSLKFPLFFLVGKQDIDVNVENVIMHDADFSAWRKRQYLLESFADKPLSIPRILNNNRINLTINNIIFKNILNRPPMPIELNSINHLVLKDLSFSNPTAFEMSSSVSFAGDNSASKSMFDFVGIGHFNLGQFFNTTHLNYKVLFEVKSVNNPVYAWLVNHRFQVLNDENGPFAKWNVHGSAIDGSGIAEMYSDSLSIRELNLAINTLEVSKENSTLKNINYLFTKTLDVADFSSLMAKVDGNITYHVGEDNSGNVKWISHLTSIWSDNKNTKVEVDLNTENDATSKLNYQLKVGTDLSYRKINLECASLSCIQDDLLSINIDFYNQIFMNSEKEDLKVIHQNIANWWSSLSTITSEKLTTPIKFSWRKSRWGDFEFDLLADASMNKVMLASDNMLIKQSGVDLAKLKFSLSNSDDGVLWRQYCKITKFPSTILAKLFSINKLEFNGEVTGKMALELSQSKNSYSTDLTFSSGSIQWLNFDDIYRRSVFKKPEDEIKFPALNWSAQFAKAKLFTQWDEKQKEIEFDFLTPPQNAKNINLSAGNNDNEFLIKVTYPNTQPLSRKYLQKEHGGNEISFNFSYLDNELKLVDSEQNIKLKSPVSE